MGMELLQFQTKVSTIVEERYKDEPGFFDHMRSNAARSMAETVLSTAAKHEKIVPKKGEPDYGLTVTYRWRVGIERDMSELEAREKQMARARYEGMVAAAEIVRSCANRFELVDGGCKWVIMDSLRAAAKEIEKATL